MHLLTRTSIPSIFEFARVRLHTGKSAPNTVSHRLAPRDTVLTSQYFVGRRVKDSVSGNFAYDFIKVVNLTSAACSAAFQLGAAETKVAMDGLTASEQIAYMRAMSGHVLRNHKQVLSAAYNLNAPLVDDLAPPIIGEDGQSQFPVLTDNIAVAKRGIELAALGGFDKVTFDGASDTYPSQCVILQVSFENALELVHLAHQAGLITYMSAGFKFAHIADAVYSGVDGIGIGGAQILRYMDSKTGHHGPYTEEFIDKIDFERDQAAHSVRGRGVNLLCRLDVSTKMTLGFTQLTCRRGCSTKVRLRPRRSHFASRSSRRFRRSTSRPSRTSSTAPSSPRSSQWTTTARPP